MEQILPYTTTQILKSVKFRVVRGWVGAYVFMGFKRDKKLIYYIPLHATININLLYVIWFRGNINYSRSTPKL